MAYRSTDAKLDLSLDELAEPVRTNGRDRNGRDGRNGRGSAQVFVGNLPYSTNWQQLKDHMRQVGDVVFCDILPEPGTALGSKGCGIVQFASPAAARRAITELTDTEIQGRKIFVREDREHAPRERLERESYRREERRGQGRCVFVGNLAYSVSWQDLKDHMRQCGEVLHCDIMAEPGTTLGSKGCGIVEFASAHAAQRAVHEMTDSMLKGRPIFVRPDREEREPTPGYKHEHDEREGYRARSRSYSDRRRWRPQGRNRSREAVGDGCRVFVGNLAYSVTWKELKDHMRGAGDVLFCEILKEPGTALGSKGCAIVEYSSAREARRAIRMTDTELRGRKMWVREDREE
ncbi:unnamed protein product [Effrenium voratum]|nr:unnamed protein product [Effrenium voratum]